MSPFRLPYAARVLSIALLAFAGVAMSTGTGVALARGHLDPTFGDGGSLEVKTEIVKGRELGQVAPSPGGAIYFTEDVYVCTHGRPPCRNREWLRRFGADGRIDPSFHPGSKVFPGLAHEVRLAVDTNGRPVFAWNRGHRVHLRRLLANGRVDRSFGHDGTVTLGCRCAVESLEATTRGSLLVVASMRRQLQDEFEPEPVGFTVEKLEEDGLPDAGFSGDGVARVGSEAWTSAEGAEAPDGSVLLTVTARDSDSNLYYFPKHLTPQGRFDVRFGRVAKATEEAVHIHSGRQWWEEVIAFPRPRGTEIFASTEGKSEIFGLNADGSLDRAFGEDGETQLDLGFSFAADAGGGRLFATGYHRGSWFVQLIDGDGRRDHNFGSLFLPRAGNEYGLLAYADGPGRAVVVSPGETICRGECPSEPRIYRVLV
jgi:hypothetical protein